MTEKNYNSVKDLLIDIPGGILAEEKNLLQLNAEIDRLEGEKKRIERKAWGVICNATTPDGKKVYTNDQMREAAQEDILSTHLDYQKFTEEQLTMRMNAKLSLIEKEYLERRFKAVIALVKILELER